MTVSFVLMQSGAVMPRAPGHDPGHRESEGPGGKPGPPAGFTWEDYVDWMVSTCGTLAAAAERIASRRGYTEDVASIERALRRLRARGQLAGGTWGLRALRVFGLPAPADQRARWMGAYHSRFTDLPLPLCVDLLRLWDRPPVSEAPAARLWLVLAHATCSLRANEPEAAEQHLARASASIAAAPPDALAERLLAMAFVASRTDPARVPALLAEVEPLLEGTMAPADRACLHARWIDQRAYEINKGRAGSGGDAASWAAGAQALYESIPTAGAPSFALCRRASGLAYARWKQGDREGGAALARDACDHAGDGGHLRLRAMSLQMLGRILGNDQGADHRARALSIVTSLDDEALRLRFSPPHR